MMNEESFQRSAFSSQPIRNPKSEIRNGSRLSTLNSQLSTPPAVKSPQDSHLPVIGWREWVALPELGISWTKAKVDTGARSSALHAFDLVRLERGGREFVRFQVHPVQRSTQETVVAEAEVIEYRRVTSSGGHHSLRPVILTTLEILGQKWTIELTLAARDAMGFRMLLGREAIRGRFLVDPSRSYFGGRPPGKGRRRVES